MHKKKQQQRSYYYAIQYTHYTGNKVNDLVFAKSYDIATAMPLVDLGPSLLEGQIKQTFTEAFIKSDSYSFNTEEISFYVSVVY